MKLLIEQSLILDSYHIIRIYKHTRNIRNNEIVSLSKAKMMNRKLRKNNFKSGLI